MQQTTPPFPPPLLFQAHLAEEDVSFQFSFNFLFPFSTAPSSVSALRLSNTYKLDLNLLFFSVINALYMSLTTAHHQPY